MSALAGMTLSEALAYLVAAVKSGTATGKSFSEALQWVSDLDFPAVGNVTTADTTNGVSGTLNMALFTLISGVASNYNVRSGIACYTGGPTGLIYVPAVGNVRKGVLVNVEDSVGTLVGCVDKNGNNQGVSGILDADSDYEGSGTLDEDGVYHSSGIIDDDGAYHADGIFDDWGGYRTTGIFSGDGYHATTGLAVAEVQDGVTWDDGDGSHEGTYDPMAAAVFPLPADVNITDVAYGPTGAEYAGALDLAGDYTLTSGIVWPAVANVSTVETAWGPTGAEYAGALDLSLYTLLTSVTSTLNANKDEMIAANDSLQAAYGCDVGTAPAGGGRMGIISMIVGGS